MSNQAIKATEYLQEYWETYTDQEGWHGYRMKTVLDDALYGIGSAISEDYRFANGFDSFKKELIEYLQTDKKPSAISPEDWGREPRGEK